MATPTGFFIWTEDDSIIYKRGEKGVLLDGLPVSLYHTLKDYLKDTGKEISQIDFKIELEENGQTIAEHSFKMDKMSTIWLVADPATSDENGSFTTAFLNVFANATAGIHNYSLKFFTDSELLNNGELEYESNGTNARYKTFIPKFNNVAATREQADQEHQQEYAEQLEQEDAEQQAKREFIIEIENTNTGHTKYILVTNQTTMSEDILEVTPTSTISLNLNRGTTYELKYYDQDSSKEYAFFIEKVDESFHEAHYKLT